MNLSEYKNSVLWALIDYDWVYGSQCVDLIKNYTATVLDIRLWTFWGSAITWWENKSDTFKEDLWIKIKNNPNDLWQIPKAGDIIFWSYWKYGHTAIVTDAYWNGIEVLEQNTWSWDWHGQDDSVTITTRWYKNILGWYRKKEPISAELALLRIENSVLKNKLKDILRIALLK